jgi:exopolysaccharide biosynthesis polyprenyl glycosylphosphotransferase
VGRFLDSREARVASGRVTRDLPRDADERALCMSTARVDDTDNLLDVAAADSVAERREPRRSPASAQIISAAGQAAVVLFAVLVPCVGTRRLTPVELLALCVTAGVWLVIVRGAFAAGHRMIGIWPPAVFGSSAGLVAAVAVTRTLPGRPPSALELLGMAAGVLAATAVWEWAVRRIGARRRRVLVVGTTEVSNDLAEQLSRAKVGDFQLIGRVDETIASGPCDVPFGGVLEDLTAIVEAQRPDLIVLTDEQTYGSAVDRLLEGRWTDARVVGLAGFFEHALGRVPVRQLTQGWFMSLVHLRQKAYGRLTKRAFDIAAAVAGLLIALPVMAVIAFVVGRTPGGPLFYRQTRLGEGGRPFTIYKFRTMAVDAEQFGQPRFASERDPRIIPGGRLIRRTHLDELPQLWNVVVGDMSIVGPRPERPEFAATLEEAVPFWHRRLLVKPGITGWAQVHSGYVADYEAMADKLAYDLWYVRNRSVALDLAICLRTIGIQIRAFLPSAWAAKGVGR